VTVLQIGAGAASFAAWSGERDSIGVTGLAFAIAIVTAVLVWEQTVEAFVTHYTETNADQRERLEQFTRMAAHEWRQPLDALQFGVRLLRQVELDSARTQRTLEAIERNVQHLVDLTHKLKTIARINNYGDNPVVQEASVTTVAGEAPRQLREMAVALRRRVRLLEPPPWIRSHRTAGLVIGPIHGSRTRNRFLCCVSLVYA
jgi:signal transduction histidine kinase